MGDDSFSLPGFDVIRLLGFGGSGEVWLARDLASGERVALKRLSGQRTVEARDRLRREAAVLRSASHPHLVRLRSLVSLPGEMVLVLDHIDGGSLAGLLARRTLSPGEVVTVLVPIAEALACAHSRGIVHGDVSPGNVLFTRDGRPMLADLGVARVFGDLAGEPQGTAGYVAPELGAGEGATPAADVYALGALVRAALFGEGASAGAASLTSLVGLPPGMAEALEAATASDPEARPGPQELAGALFELCAPEPVLLSGEHAEPAADEVTIRVASRSVDRPDHATGKDGARARRARRRGPETPARTAGAITARRRLLTTAVARTADPPPSGPGSVSGSRSPTSGSDKRVKARLAAVVSCGVLVAAGVVLVNAHLLPGGVAGRPAAAEPSLSAAPAAAEPSSLAEPSSSAPAAAEPSSWTAVVASLDRRRSAALARLDAAGLRALYAPSSPALPRDLAVIAKLRADATRPRASTPTLIDVSPETAPPGAPARLTAGARAVIRVVDRRSTTQLLDSSTGAVIGSVAGRSAQEWRVTVAAVAGAWRYLDVERL